MIDEPARNCAKAAPRVRPPPADHDVNLALKDIRHNLGRFLLTCVGLSLLLGIVLAMVGIYRGLILESLGLARAAGAHVWVVEGGTRGPFAEASRLPGDTREIIAAQWGVAAAGAVAYQNVEAQHRGDDQAPAGRRRRDRRGPGEAPARWPGRPILRSRYEAVADRSAGLALGEQIKLGRDTFTVVGLTENLVASGGDPVVFVTLRDAQKLQFDLTPAAARREAARTPGVDRLDRYRECRSGAAAARTSIAKQFAQTIDALEASRRADPGRAGKRACRAR